MAKNSFVVEVTFNIMLETKLRFSFFFLTFSSLFSLIVYLVRFNTDNNHHFLNTEGEKNFE